MDPLTTIIMTVLGKYAVDKGAVLAEKVGLAAAEAAEKLFTKVMARLRADPGEAKNAERYEKDPKTFEAPMAAAVDDQIKADPNFAKELQQLVEQFDAGPINVGNTTTNRSGGVDFNVSGGSVNIGGKVAGGDLIDKGD